MIWRYLFSSGRVTTSHHTAVMTSAMDKAVIWLSPTALLPSTSARQTTKGTQLPI